MNGIQIPKFIIIAEMVFFVLLTPAACLHAEENAEFYYSQGQSCFSEKKYESAIQSFSKAVELDSGNASYHVWLGNAYEENGQHNLAIQAYGKAIEINPNSANAYCHRGIAFARDWQLDAAIRDFDEALRLDPRFVQAYHSRGLTYDRKDEMELAIMDYSKAIELDSTNADTYFNRGYDYYLIGNKQKSESDYHKAVELDHRLATKISYAKRSLLTKTIQYYYYYVAFGCVFVSMIFLCLPVFKFASKKGVPVLDQRLAGLQMAIFWLLSLWGSLIIFKHIYFEHNRTVPYLIFHYLSGLILLIMVVTYLSRYSSEYKKRKKNKG